MTNEQEILKTLYEKLCESYHKVDDFRAKLLGFLPLASGIAIFGLLAPNAELDISDYKFQIGLFGALVTLGLLLYELKGIQKCTSFIRYGSEIEEQLLKTFPDPELNGFFQDLNSERKSNNYASEPVASAVIYSTVFASWLYLVIGWYATIAGVLAFIFIIVFWRNLLKVKAPFKYDMDAITIPKDINYLAPDGSEIRLLLEVQGGGMCHCTLPPHAISKAIKHKTVEEIWFFLEGEGEVWRKWKQKWKIKSEESISTVTPGMSLSIPVGAHFQFRNRGEADLKFIIATTPRWPGEKEAIEVKGKWGFKD